MRILVIYGNQELLDRTRPIFESYPHKWLFVRDSDIDFTVDFTGEVYDMVFSLHCRKIFPKWLVESIKCINIHTGYNPYNRGMFPHVWSIINGLPAGATIHEMDDKIDHGKIIAQQQIPVSPYDTSETLYKRVQFAEITLLKMTLESILNGTYTTSEPIGQGNYNSMEDFKKLCEINLGKIGTYGEFYNLLRALSHGEYKNAKLNDRHLKLEII